MQRLITPLLALLALSSATLALQERAAKPKAKDFGALVTEAKTAFEGQRYGAAVTGLRDALALASKAHRKAIFGAYPAAPAGWTLEPPAEEDEVPAALAGLAALGGSQVQGSYSGPNGASLGLTVMIDSPMAQMITMWASNPALLGDDAEVVKYGAHRAVLRTREKGSSYELQLLVGDDIVQVDLQGADDDLLFRVLDQAAVDRLALALAQ